MNTRLRRVVTVLAAVLLTVTGTAVLSAPASAVTGEWWVSPGGHDIPECGDSDTFTCLTIQYAIDKAAPGDTVTVLAGTYTENVAISAPVTLTGTSATIDGSVSVGTVAGAVTVQGFAVSSDVATTLISVADTDPAADVTISGNTITGTSPSSQTGIAVSPSTSVSITGNTFAMGSGGGAAIFLAAPNPSDTVNVTLGGNTGTVAAPTRTIDESGAGTITVTPTDTPNTITPTPAPTVGLVGFPSKLTALEPPVEFDGTAAIPSTGSTLDHARYDITITGTSGITATQLDLEYQAGSNWLPVPLSGNAAAGDAITGFFGPLAGFPFPSGAANTTHFRLSVSDNSAAPGSLAVRVALDEISQGPGNPVLNVATSDPNAGTVDIAHNQAPAATPKTASVRSGDTVQVDLGPTTDGDGDGVTYTVDQGQLGAVTVSGHTATYVAASASGTDSFSFKATDSHNLFASNTVSITVTARNNPPVVTHTQTVAVAYATSKTITLGPVLDSDGDTVIYSCDPPGFGTVTACGASAAYMPPANKAVATTSFTFTGSDGQGGSDTGTVTIKVGKARPTIGSVTFSPAHPTSAQVPKATIAVTAPAGSVTGGTVTVTYGSSKRTAKVSGGKATVNLSKFTGGAHKFSIAFAGTATTSSATATKTLTVSKVHTTLAVTTSPKQLTTRTKGTLKVKVTAAGASINGKTVLLKSGARVIGTAKVVRRVATITLPKLSLGQHNWSVYYPGSTTASAATQTVILRVALG